MTHTPTNRLYPIKAQRLLAKDPLPQHFYQRAGKRMGIHIYFMRANIPTKSLPKGVYFNLPIKGINSREFYSELKIIT